MRSLRLTVLAVAVLSLPMLAVPAQADVSAQAPPTASQLLAKVNSCRQISNGKFKTDTEKSRTIAVCGATGAVFWKADMDIDCDGVRTSRCNEDTDPWFQPDTALHTSRGRPFNAETTRYVVIPQNNPTFRYSSHNIRLGAVAAIIYNNRVSYAVFADTGPTDIIGEASYGAARSLGIDPDPQFGGAERGVTYIIFQGTQVNPVESHAAMDRVGAAAAQRFINNN